MSEELVIVDKEDLTAIADAVRESTGSTEEFNVSELRTAAVVALSAGGGAFAEHIEDKNNPHEVTAAQVGAAPVGLTTGYYTASTDEQLDSILQTVLASMEVRTQKVIVVYLDSTEPALKGGTWFITINKIDDRYSHFNAESYAGIEVTKKYTRVLFNSELKPWVREDPTAFAPSGYGLGLTGSHLTALTDANEAQRNGWYLINKNTANGVGQVAIVRVDCEAWAHCVQTAYSASYSSSTPMIMRRVKNGGTWKDWEWENPRMTLGEEYRTTERYNGEVVYTKLINCGAMPNASEKIIGHGVSGMKQPLSVSVTAYKSNWAFTLPSSHTNEASVLLNTNGVQIATTIDRSEYTAYALIKYTKN